MTSPREIGIGSTTSVAHRELRGLFDERAAMPPMTGMYPTRLAEVHDRVTRLRRRRAATSVTAVLAAVALAVGIPYAVSGAHLRRNAVPAYQQTVDGLKVWVHGGRLTGHASFDTSHRHGVTFTATPTSWELSLAFRCTRDLGSTTWVAVTMNGHPLTAGTCSAGEASVASIGGPGGGGRRAMTDLGARPGQPSRFHIYLARDPRFSSSPLALPISTAAVKDTQIALGIYSRVAATHYPLPPRPTRLHSLESAVGQGSGALVDTITARTRGRNSSYRLTEVLPAGGLTYSGNLAAPGQLLVSINGTPIGRHEAWDYNVNGFAGLTITPESMRPYGLHLKVGQPVSIVVRASRFQDDAWNFLLQRPAPAGG